jgi:hypothetical protein
MEYYEGNSNEAAVQLFMAVVVLWLIGWLLIVAFKATSEGSAKAKKWLEKPRESRDKNENTPDSKNGF